MTARRIETMADITEGVDALAALDPGLAAIIEPAGLIPLRRRGPGIEGLASVVVGQMVSRASAEAIWRRLVAEVDTVTPQTLLTLTDESARTVGLSRAKRDTLRAIAKAAVTGIIDLEAVCDLPSDEATAHLTALKGVGPWTAEVYLLFCAGHCDVFPAGDIALQTAAARALSLDRRPDARAMRILSDRWKPWRSVAARVLWAYYAGLQKRPTSPIM
ncbi:DNA-3-methyladenine glycosylase family protein [Pararhizobium haloflavum]|uniref:DNA-3-methyladenine glycosylase family protein n=1 Tax=Pararhizobium haloflavum TaxID=2037914 RepID=UPI000C184F5F|nr:DNA-3-methyladenine glycosylase [Pararhizobium haloflavum]